MNLSTLLKTTREVGKKYQPEILIGIGVVGFITTAVTAVKVTPKALDRMAEIKDRLGENPDKKEFTKEVITKVVPVYIPSVAMGITSTACIVGASSINFRRNAALATAYSIAETNLKDYREKVVETIGEKKERTVRDAIAKERLERDPVTSKEVIMTARGETLCYDPLTGRYFKSDIDYLKRVANELNRRMRNEMYVTLNDFYLELDLDPVGIGYDLGWNIDRGYIDLDFSSQLADNGTPCLVVGHDNPPTYRFR